MSLRIGEKLRYVAQRDLESIAAQTTSLVHRLALIVAGEQRRRRFDPKGLFEHEGKNFGTFRRRRARDAWRQPAEDERLPEGGDLRLAHGRPCFIR